MKKIIIPVVGAFLVLSLGVAALATKTYNPSWNPFRLSPEEVLAKSLAKQKNIKSQSLDGEIKVQGESQDLNSFHLKMKMDGQLKEIEGGYEFDMNTTYEGGITGMTFTAKMKIIRAEGENYIKIEEFPMIPLFSFSSENYDQWIKMEAVEDKEETKMSEKLKEIWSKKDLFQIKEDLGEESINGNKAYHYKVVLNKEDLKSLIFEFSEVMKTEEAENLKRTEMEEELNDLLEKMGEVEVELWIGKKDFYVYRITLNKELNLAKFENGEEGSLLISSKFDFFDFDKEFEITPPEEAKTWEEAFPTPEIEPYPTPGEYPQPSYPDYPGIEETPELPDDPSLMPFENFKESQMANFFFFLKEF